MLTVHCNFRHVTETYHLLNQQVVPDSIALAKQPLSLGLGRSCLNSQTTLTHTNSYRSVNSTKRYTA